MVKGLIGPSFFIACGVGKEKAPERIILLRRFALYG